MPAFCVDMTSGKFLTVLLLLHPTLLFMQLGSLHSVPGHSKNLPGCRRGQNICRRSPVRRRKQKACQSETSVLWLCFKVFRTVCYSFFLCPERKEQKKISFPMAPLLNLIPYLCRGWMAPWLLERKDMYLTSSDTGAFPIFISQ